MSFYSELAAVELKDEAVALCIIVRTAGSTPRHAKSKMLVFRDGSISGSVGGGEVENRVIAEATASLSDGKTRLLHYELVNPERGDPGVCGGTVDVYIEPILPKPTLLIVGGGHVGKAVAKLGKFTGFYVIVSDDRAELCTATENPDADQLLCCEMSLIPTKVRITPWTYVVVTTRGSDVDIDGLPGIIGAGAPYIGVIGSKRRWMSTRKGLLDQGISEEDIRQVYAPIGLSIGAESPEEIAVSILAEIIMVRNGLPVPKPKAN